MDNSYNWDEKKAVKNWCNQCNKPITKKEYNYSKDKFGKALCREHQSKLSKLKHKRNEPTREAKMLGKLLNEKGWGVELEKWDGHKHIDIAIEEAKAYLEIDGVHHNTNIKQAFADLERTYHSFKEGYVTLRIPNCLVGDDLTIYKTAHFVDSFLSKSLEALNEDIEEIDQSKGFVERIIGKKIKFV